MLVSEEIGLAKRRRVETSVDARFREWEVVVLAKSSSRRKRAGMHVFEGGRGDGEQIEEGLKPSSSVVSLSFCRRTMLSHPINQLARPFKSSLRPSRSSLPIQSQIQDNEDIPPDQQCLIRVFAGN